MWMLMYKYTKAVDFNDIVKQPGITSNSEQML